jgi:hypothetical protein
VNDNLRSYGAAKSEIGLSARHEHGLRMNNRAENRTSPHDGASARCSVSNRRTLRVLRDEAFRTWRAAAEA